MVWGANAKDKGEPVRVEKAFPAIVTKAQFQLVGKRLSSRAPKFSHPRRVGSSYLLSGLVKCQACSTSLIGRFAKSGQYSYYVCQSNISFGKDACNTPTLNARRFEELVIAKIRSNVLTKGNVRELVKVVAEEMDGVTREQRKSLRAIKDELEDVKKRTGAHLAPHRDDRHRHGRRLGPHQRASGAAKSGLSTLLSRLGRTSPSAGRYWTT